MALRYLSVAALLLAAACYGKLPLRYGETLCDAGHPCPDGMMCADSICIPDTRGDQDVVTTDDFVGDWENPFPGDETVPNDFCRSDEQCDNGEGCVDGVCRRTPCFGVTCPGVGDVCAYQCIPTSASCDGVHCVDNLEHCVNGSCVPSCDIDPCVDPGCSPSDPNCVAGDCKNGTLCFGGVCREITPCGDDGDAFCGPGFICSLGCNTPSLCDSISCNAGWSCSIQTDVLGIQFPTCIGSPCSGLACGAGESCIGGECIDRCEFVPCADGGRQCNTPGALCCNGTCCAPGEICRVVRDDEPGVCLRPEGVCDPACSADEICVAGECLCAEYPNPRECGGTECCRSQTCDNPCSPNPCSGADPLCTVDCNEPSGYRCVNDCGGVVCPLLHTVCEPASGSCLCGTPGQQCSGTQCCVDVDASPAVTTFACDDPCSPNPCTAGDNHKCNRDCTTDVGYTCTDFCATVTCGPNMTCDPANGNCTCGSFPTCAGTNCCVNVSGTLDCKDPCSPNPCGAEQCVRNCAAPTGFSCQNNCTAGQCSADVRNPDCNPASGTCSCQSDATSAYAVCNTSQCCNDSGVCTNPCSPNPCPTAGDPGNFTHCNPQCAASGNDFTCTDPCAGNTCATANTGRNPDCRPDPANPNQAQCFCDDTDPDTVCGSGTCCEGSGCLNPCSPNACPSDPGNPNDGTAGFTRCNVNCNDTNDYTCSNPCAGNTCGSANGGRNPDCRSTSGGASSECYCAPSNTICPAAQCCQGVGCVDPCAGNPCGGSGVCVVDCSQPGDFRCNPLCTAGNCPSQNPICDPDDTNHACECVGDTVCSGNTCCTDQNGDGTRDGCDDPCTPNPCGATGVCVRNCAVLVGYTCNNQCSGTTCPNQNPDCDPIQTDPALRCTCNLTDICAGAECCLSDVCDDACQPDPCTVAPNTRCINDCAQGAGFRCNDPCAANSCSTSAAGKNPQCRSSGANGDSAQCYCATATAVCAASQCCDKGVAGCDDPCSPDPCGMTGVCAIDCTTVNGYVCNPVQCVPACVSPLTCNLANGHCLCGSDDASTMSCGAPQQPAGTYPNACCDPAGPTPMSCVPRECTSDAQCRAVGGASANCVCDPCTGCSVPSGESGNCPPVP